MLACASDAASPHPDLAPVWRDFLALPAERALAIAGDPRRGRWVTGASGGHATHDQAEAEALAQCQMRRALRRMQAECVLYGVRDEIVWRGH
jgi:sugar phosphate isomerase/epimerase